MRIKIALFAILALLLAACDYIVTPEPEESSGTGVSTGWSGIVTAVEKSGAGDLHVEFTLRNDSGDWSALQAAPTATLTGGDGKTSTCETVFAGSGGHRLAPGFQMRGYTNGSKSAPLTQLIYVECKGATATPGAKLALDYTYYSGELNFYDPEAHKSSARLELSLDKVVKDLKYPLAAPVEGLVLKADAQIKAINDCILTLTSAKRNEKGLELAWQTSNPGEYPTYVHIGIPPVIGEDGIIYGFYESPHLASAPITGAGQTAAWTTQVLVPKDVKGLYILASVESKQQRLFTNYAIDITTQ